jgi:hypothetical protein
MASESLGALDGNLGDAGTLRAVRHRQRRIQHAAVEMAARSAYDLTPRAPRGEPIGHDEREVGLHAPGAPALQQIEEPPDQLPDRLEPARRDVRQHAQRAPQRELTQAKTQLVQERSRGSPPSHGAGRC